MKTKILTVPLAFLFLTTTAALGLDANQPTTSKEVTTDGNYKKITVGENIKLVLVPADQLSAITVTGDMAKVNDVTVKTKRDELSITSKYRVKPGSITVYVPATDLSYIDLNKGASVAGKGDLTFKDLTVFVNVDCKMELTMMGILI
jgi:Protein of unknown function (DUF2807).